MCCLDEYIHADDHAPPLRHSGQNPFQKWKSFITFVFQSLNNTVENLKKLLFVLSLLSVPYDIF